MDCRLLACVNEGTLSFFNIDLGSLLKLLVGVAGREVPVRGGTRLSVEGAGLGFLLAVRGGGRMLTPDELMITVSSAAGASMVVVRMVSWVVGES